MAEPSFSLINETTGEVGLNVVMDLHSRASAVLNDVNSTNTATGVFMSSANLQRPATPQLNLKLEVSSSSSESDEDTYGETGPEGSGTSSPRPKCAICLGRCKNKCCTDSCMHQFCFKCLCEWSKVKPECPLCKQTFKCIIQNVKSIDQVEEYYVDTPANPEPSLFRPVDPNMLRHVESNPRLPNTLETINDIRRRWVAFEVSLNDAPRGRLMRSARTTFYPSTSTADGTPAAADAGDAPAETVPMSGGNAETQTQYQGELWDEYRREYLDGLTSNAVQISDTLSQLWRRYIYDWELYALPVCDAEGHFRECSSRFYNENPSQLDLLMPWISRDLVCLLRQNNNDISAVLEALAMLLTAVNILSSEFRRRLQPILGRRTAHFIHELYNFARSPYDMISYDSVVEYSPRSTEEIVIDFTSSSEGDGLSFEEDSVSVIDADGNPAYSRAHRIHRNSNLPSQAAANGSRENQMQSRHPSNSTRIGTFNTFTTGRSDVSSAASVPTDGGRVALAEAINLTMHNRTSDVVIDLDATDTNAGLSANSNDGLQIDASIRGSSALSTAFPAPAVTENIELSSTTSSDECIFVLERKPPHLRTPELVSLNSESDSDVVFVEQDCQQAQAKQTKAKNVNVPEKPEGQEETYNVGASTSAGVRSSGRRSRQIKKTRQRKRTLRHYEKNVDFRSSDSELSTDADEEERGRIKKTRAPSRRITQNKTLRSANVSQSRETISRKRKRSDGEGSGRTAGTKVRRRARYSMEYSEESDSDISYPTENKVRRLNSAVASRELEVNCSTHLEDLPEPFTEFPNAGRGAETFAQPTSSAVKYETDDSVLAEQHMSEGSSVYDAHNEDRGNLAIDTANTHYVGSNRSPMGSLYLGQTRQSMSSEETVSLDAADHRSTSPSSRPSSSTTSSMSSSAATTPSSSSSPSSDDDVDDGADGQSATAAVTTQAAVYPITNSPPVEGIEDHLFDFDVIPDFYVDNSFNQFYNEDGDVDI